MRDAFTIPLTPADVGQLDWYFRARQGQATDPAPGPDLDLATGSSREHALDIDGGEQRRQMDADTPVSENESRFLAGFDRRTRAQAIADGMMADLDKETVDFAPNYDETTEEPSRPRHLASGAAIRLPPTTRPNCAPPAKC